MVLVVTHGNYGKPRPAVVVQDDAMWRLNLTPNDTNGLMRNCQVMIDKIAAASPNEIKRSIGRLSREEMDAISASLAVLLGLAT